MSLLAAVLLGTACGKHEAPAPPLGPVRGDTSFEEIALNVPPGESDLTTDDAGKLWTVPERDRFAIEIRLHDSTVKTIKHPIDGVPDGVDIEGVAWLGARQFALATEGKEVPSASILFAQLEPDGHLLVTASRQLTNSDLGVKLQNNRGAEAICGKGDDLLVGIEEAGKFSDGSRWAPLVRLRGSLLSLAKFRLTSETGKLAALDCDFAPDGSIEVLAIERDYGVRRILHATVAPHAIDLTPTIALDLGPILPDTYNFEGIAHLPDGRLLLINDNQSRTVEGPTKLFVLKRPSRWFARRP